MKNFITSVYCCLFFFSWYKIYKTWRFRYQNHYGFQELSWTIPFIYHELYISVHGRTLICIRTSYTLNGYTWCFHINTRTIKWVLKTCFIFFMPLPQYGRLLFSQLIHRMFTIYSSHPQQTWMLLFTRFLTKHSFASYELVFYNVK